MKLACSTSTFPLKSSSGFTMIELLVTILVASVLAGAGLVYFNTAGADQKVQNSARELQTTLRYAQNLATSGSICETIGQATYVYVQVGTSTTVTKYCPGGVTDLVKTLKLPDGVTIAQTFPAPPDTVTEIRFNAVTGNVTFVGGGSPERVTYQLTKGSTQNVTIYSSGRIEIF